MSLAITVGHRVMVSENLAFHSDYTPVMRKHTANFNLKDTLSLGVGNIQRNFRCIVQGVERWQETLLTNATSKLLEYEAFIEGVMGISKHLVKSTNDNPPHEEFAPRTMWSLNNVFSGAAKAVEPIALQRTAHSIGQFFQARGM
jgi:hypothetical protein